MYAYYSDLVQDPDFHPIPGVKVTVRNADNALASLYDRADSGTAVLIDQLANPVTTDALGKFQFYANDNVYSAEFSRGGRVIREDKITVGDPPQYIGPPGPAFATYVLLSAFKAAAISNKVQVLQAPGIAAGLFNWETANAPYTADDINVIKADSTALSVGAWVRQSSSGLTFTQSGPDPVARSVEAELRDWIKPQQKGADPTGVVASDAAFNAALAEAVARGAGLDLAGGTFKLTSGAVNFAFADLHIRGGGATLNFTGAGPAFVIDQGGADGDHLEGMSVEDILIVGNINTTHGFYQRGVVRSAFRNIEVRDAGAHAFHIKHAVSCHYDNLKYSPRPLSGPPPLAVVHVTHGLYLDNNGAGQYTGDSTFTNLVIESFDGPGVYLADASGCVFVGGTSEGVGTGLVVTQPCDRNTFINFWCEANTIADAIISGNGNGFIAPYFSSSSPQLNVQILGDAGSTWFTGGYVRSVHIAGAVSITTTNGSPNLSGTGGLLHVGQIISAVGVPAGTTVLSVAGTNAVMSANATASATVTTTASVGTTLHQVGVDENLGGGIGFQGTGKYTRIGCNKIGDQLATTGYYEDIIGAVQAIGTAGVWTPVLTPASGTITPNAGATQGSYQRIGPLVFAQAFINVTSVSSPTGALKITGLPYTSAQRQPGSVFATQLASSATDPIQVRADPSSTELQVSKVSAGASAAMSADIQANSTLSVSITYLALL